MKPDFHRIQSLLREAVTMLCKNSLPYKQELCVEGLLGITLDKEDIFLVNIKEILKPHEIVSPVDETDSSQLDIRERSSSPANYDQEDNGDRSVECSAVSTRAVVPIFKAPSKVQRSHKRAVSNSSELSHHWWTSLSHHGSGDPAVSDWEEGVSMPPHSKRRHLTSSHLPNSPTNTLDIDSLPVMEVKKEVLDDSVTSASITNYHFQHSTDNINSLSELNSYSTVHLSRGEAETKHILPVSLPSIAGLTSSSWHLGSGDVLSTSVSSLPNLSSDMVSAGLPSSHFNSSMVPSERDLPAATAVRPPQTAPPSMPEPAAHLAAAAIILASPGPFHSVRALHRKLQRRVRSSSQLMYVVEGLVRDGLASLVQVVVRPARRSKAVFYKTLPPPAEDNDATKVFAQRLAGYGVPPDVYVDQLRLRDPQMDVFTHAALLREHPDPQRLVQYYRQYDHIESESDALPVPGHQQRPSEPAMTVRSEHASETRPDFDRTLLFHGANSASRTHSKTAPDGVTEQCVDSDVSQAQGSVVSYSELHHLQLMCAASGSAPIETESETFPGNTRSCASHDLTEKHEAPIVFQQTDNNDQSAPQS